MPAGLRETYEAFAQDPDLVSLRDDIAVLDARIAELLQSTAEIPTVKMWKNLLGIANDLQTEEARQDPDLLLALTDELIEQVEQGIEATSAWSDVVDLIEQRRKLVDTESRRTHRDDTSLSAEQAALLVTRMADTVLRVFDRYEVPDDAQAEITDATYELLGPPE